MSLKETLRPLPRRRGTSASRDRARCSFLLRTRRGGTRRQKRQVGRALGASTSADLALLVDAGSIPTTSNNTEVTRTDAS